MSTRQALALRRLLLCVAALAAALAAHAAGAGRLGLTPAAPLLWAAFAAATVPVGWRRAVAWRERGPAEVLARLAGLQAGLHLAMGAAPWAFGLQTHHHAPLVTTGALVAHGVAALLLAAALVCAERLLSLAQGVARAVRAALAARAPSGAPRVGVAPHRARPAPARRRRPDLARGPPALAVR